MNNNECLAVRIKDDDVCDSESGESSDEGNNFPHTTTSLIPSLNPSPITNNLFLIHSNYC